MVKRIVITMATVLVSTVASAQNRGDSTVTLFDDLKVPLVEKKYVANTNFQDNWYLSLYGGVTSNFGSDCSHSGFFRLMGPAAMLAVGKEITPVSGVRFQINYNRNTGVTDNQFGTVDFPNWNTPKAFIVMEPYAAGLGPDHNLGGEKWLAHSGKQYFAGFYSAVPDAGEIDNNDYMVSPLLSGEAQTISFWAKGYRGTEATGYQTEMAFNETLEVLYTTDADNLDPTTYTVIKETFKVNDKTWEQYLAELPAGAKHFALHRNSAKREYTEYEGATVEVPETGSFVMMIDDIEFNVAAMTVTGYKVYKNGTLLTTLDASTTTYTARRIEDSDTFTVKAVYGDSESADSNPISIDILNDIRQVVNASSNVNGTAIYNLRGQRVQSMSQPGLYIIKQGNTSRKVIVK